MLISHCFRRVPWGLTKHGCLQSDDWECMSSALLIRLVGVFGPDHTCEKTGKLWLFSDIDIRLTGVNRIRQSWKINLRRHNCEVKFRPSDQSEDNYCIFVDAANELAYKFPLMATCQKTKSETEPMSEPKGKAIRGKFILKNKTLDETKTPHFYIIFIRFKLRKSSKHTHHTELFKSLYHGW